MLLELNYVGKLYNRNPFSLTSHVPGHLLSQRPASLKRREAARVYFLSCNRKKSEVISSKNLEAKRNTIGVKEPHYYY